MMFFAILAALAVFPAVNDKKLAASAASFALLIFISLPYVGERGLYWKTENFWSACIVFEAVIATALLLIQHDAGRVAAVCCLFNITVNAVGNLIWVESGGHKVLESYYTLIMTSDIIKTAALFAFSPPATKLLSRLIYGKPAKKDQMTWIPRQSNSF